MGQSPRALGQVRVSCASDIADGGSHREIAIAQRVRLPPIQSLVSCTAPFVSQLAKRLGVSIRCSLYPIILTTKAQRRRIGTSQPQLHSRKDKRAFRRSSPRTAFFSGKTVDKAVISTTIKRRNIAKAKSPYSPDLGIPACCDETPTVHSHVRGLSHVLLQRLTAETYASSAADGSRCSSSFVRIDRPEHAGTDTCVNDRAYRDR